MIDLGHLELRGGDVLLRPLQPADAAALASASAESRASYGLSPVPDGLPETTAYVAAALAQKAAGARYPFTLEWQGRVVGTTSYYDYQPWAWSAGCQLQRTQRPDCVEVGYTWLSASAQRTRCNTQAKLLLFQHAFETWQVHGVSLRTDERNLRSRNAIERVGAKLDGIRRAHMPASDCTVRNSALYSIVAAEWPEARERLRRMLAG